MKIIICLLLTATCFIIVKAEEEEDDTEGGILERFYGQRYPEGRNCEIKNRLGVCKRRNRCRSYTDKFCRGGINPIVCCMEEMAHPPKVIITNPPRTTTRKPIRTNKRVLTTRRPQPATLKTDEIKEFDIIFPDCGTRSPKGPSPTTKAPPSGRRGGLFGGSRRGRKKRFAQNMGLSGLFGARAIKPVIVGGVTAKPYSWPWMVAIFKKVGPNFRFLCGASLISQKYVLTAAHCFTKNDINEPSKFSIKVGAHNANEGKSYPVESILSHPKYKEKLHYYDMALLKVPEVTLDSTVNPVCLPSRGLRNRIGSTKKNVTVIGWGDTSFGGPSSKVLQEVDLPIVPVKQCNESYYKIASQIFPDGINQLFMCAGFKDGGKDACQGDSGGPLTMQMEGGRYVQLGIVSFGMACAQPGFPGVYTRVSQFGKWIYDNTDLGQVSRTSF